MEWIKAMTEEMKGPMRQPSEKTRHLAEKIDQKALEEVSPSMVYIAIDSLLVFILACRSQRLLLNTQSLYI